MLFESSAPTPEAAFSSLPNVPSIISSRCGCYDVPSSPLLIKHAMPTHMTPNLVIARQLDFTVTVAADIGHNGTRAAIPGGVAGCVGARCAGELICLGGHL
jgi:hypothetical protein